VDFTGRVMSSFTDVKSPQHLVLDNEGNVLVADSGNHRILLLSSQLQLLRVLIDKLWGPTRLCYNEVESQLYVAHRSSEMWSPSKVVSVFSLQYTE